MDLSQTQLLTLKMHKILISYTIFSLIEEPHGAA